MIFANIPYVYSIKVTEKFTFHDDLSSSFPCSFDENHFSFGTEGTRFKVPRHYWS